MNKRKSIDELFKSGLDGKGLPYTPEYWQAAEAGLGAVQPSVRKKRVLFVILFLLSGSALFWLGYSLRTDSPYSDNSLTAPNAQITSELPPTLSTEETTNSPGNALESNPLTATVRGLDLTNPASGTSVIPGPIATEDAAQPIQPEMDVSSEPIFREENVSDAVVPVQRQFEFLSIASRIFNTHFAKRAAPSPKFAGSTPPFATYPRAWAWYVGADAGISIVQRDLGAYDKEVLKQAEQLEPAATCGLTIQARRGHWTVSGGLARQTVREQHNYVVPVETWQYDTSVRMTQPYYTETKRGTRVALLQRFVDSTSSIQYTTPCPNCEAQFRYLRIPVSIQYEFGGNRLLGFTGIGMNYWRLRSVTGNYAAADQSGDGNFSIRDLSDLSGMRRNLFFWQAEAGMRYRINRMWNLSGAVSLSRSNNSLFDSYTHRIRVQQARIGLEYRIR